MTSEVIEKVMAKVEEFYMGEGNNSGEYIFDQFAKKHASLFDDEFDLDGSE